MFDYDTQRKLIVIFVIAVVLVVIFTIVALVLIWMPEEEAKFEPGNVTITNVTEANVVENYYKDIRNLFLNNNVNELYNLTSKDYLDYFKFDIDDLKEYFEKKGVLGKTLELVKYSTYLIPGYNNVYELDLKSSGEAYSINVVIKEMSPNNYTLGYEMFIDYKQSAYNASVDSVELNVYKMIRYTNSVQFEYTLRNNYDKKIQINDSGSANSVILVNTSNEVKRPIINSISTAKIQLNPKEKISCTAVFNIESTNDYYFFNLFVIKDVKYEDMNGTKNIEYNLNK